MTIRGVANSRGFPVGTRKIPCSRFHLPCSAPRGLPAKRLVSNTETVERRADPRKPPAIREAGGRRDVPHPPGKGPCRSRT
jgi:hypothetical protein